MKNSENKKILVDARSLSVQPSGIGMYTYHVVKELMKYFSISLVSDVCESKEMKELRRMGCVVYEYGQLVQKNIQLIGYYRFVQKCIDQHNPDLFWECNNLVPRKLNVPGGKCIATVHDMFPISDPQHYGLFYSLYFRYGMKKTFENFDAFIYDSVSTKHNAEKYFPKAKDKKNYVGYVMVPPYSPKSDKDNGAFLYVGNLETRKGTDILLDAYRLYRQQGGTRSLRIAGKMRETRIKLLYEQLVKQVDGLNYLGYISQEERDHEYAHCHAFVFPTRAEGFGMPVVEALYYEKPILVSDDETVQEVVGDCLHYFTMDKNPSQNLAKLMLEDPTDVDVEAYAEKRKKYTPEVLGVHYRNILNEIIG